MKALHNLLKKMEPPFKEGGKLHKFWPVYDGFATFLFVPGHVTHKGTHIRDGIDLKRTMITVVFAMIPALLFGIYNVGFQHFRALGQLGTAGTMDMVVYGLIKVLPLLIVSYGVGLGVEFLFCIIKKHSINEGFLVSGMLIPLVCPPDIPLWMVGLATIFAVVFGKEVFGGTGMNILNVALTARAFLFFAYPAHMSGDSVWVSLGGQKPVDGFSGATALGQFVSNGTNITTTTGQPMSFMDGVIGLIPGSIGETSVIAIAIGAAILILSGIGSWKVMLSVFLGGAVTTLLLNALAPSFPNNPYLAVGPEYHLAFGGFAFGAVFMATDPVTAAQTGLGKWIYGFLIGVLCITIRVLNPAYPEGMMLSILFANISAPLIDYYVVQGNVKRRLKRLKVKAA